MAHPNARPTPPPSPLLLHPDSPAPPPAPHAPLPSCSFDIDFIDFSPGGLVYLNSSSKEQDVCMAFNITK